MSENFLNIGEILQSLRVNKGIALEELAEDICSVEELDLMEKNKQVPTIDQLFMLANKLNVKLSDFFDFTSADSASYVSAVSGLINKYKRERNYKAIDEIVQREKVNPLFNFPSSQQFLLWNEAICLYYLSEPQIRDKETSVKMLNEALDITNPLRKGLSEREIEIKMSIAIIEKDHMNFEGAITILKEILEDIDKFPALAEPQIRLRALFGLSQSLSRLNKFEESLIYSEKGIKQCINDEVLYLLGEFLYQSASNNLALDNKKLGIDYLNKALNIFKLQENHAFSNFVENELEKLSKE
ncbi:helix-turn-helix domain-containing protein [Lederbergia wuyishanensis]|uniref:Transcriptional regulator with XRE-family HTH domain n=1 Tax=Lederbergia wuyishanensis TaxID=1347903 RepID=A0ABU0D6K6_9BACI|nr:helix-turn-helix transcriptional regulator [Lederbergia wuyishanensis]MCJ8008538.1 helix-turn-helix transcriptional regulator [Lederbergia wuyishanensis]MDQ0344048.1 transcriptional regulator with XRE-family HTH domain [Lederbergia wuyishanensis]